MAVPRGGRESAAARAKRAEEICRRLAATYPDATCSLDFRSPFELVVATILSAQCTDRRVNMVTGDLFARWPTAARMATATQAAVEEVIRTTGFFRAKAKNILGCCQSLVDRHGGEVPRTLAELVKLPGVGRKTANVVLGSAFGIPSGVVVDTHVARLSARLGLSRGKTPQAIERDLMALFPRDEWCLLSHLLIFHGRRACKARGGDCANDAICQRFCSEAKSAAKTAAGTSRKTPGNLNRTSKKVARKGSSRR